MSDEGIKVKAGVGPLSAELAIGEKAPGILAALMPGRMARARLKQAIVDQVVERIRAGNASDGDIEYVKTLLGDAEAKLLRQHEIAQRAEAALKAMPPTPQLPPMPGNASEKVEAEKGAATAEDWLSRFWDDAGLVSDGLLQEIYARILASEARTPGTCSLRTLRVLRYLDRQAADDFARMLPLVINSVWVPTCFDDDVEKAFGVDVGYPDLLALADAGLVDSREVGWGSLGAEKPQFFTYGTLVLQIRGWQKHPMTDLTVYTLTTAGRELARVAQVRRSREVFFAIARWVRERISSGSSFTWAEVPVGGRVDPKDWQDIPEADKPAVP